MQTKTETRRYKYGDRILEVIPGLLEKFTWMTGWRTQSGPIRFRSKYLPVRGSQIEAEIDLDSWAGDHGLEAVK